MSVSAPSDEIARRENVQPIVAHAIELGEWIGARASELLIPTEDAVLLPALCFSLAVDHHRGIVILLNEGAYPSAFALGRPISDAFVRGSWLRECATPAEVQAAKIDGLRVGYGDMLDALEKTETFAGGALTKMSADSRDLLHSFAHGGAAQLVRQLSPDGLTATFKASEVQALISQANCLAILAFQALAAAAGRHDLVVSALEKMRSLLDARD